MNNAHPYPLIGSLPTVTTTQMIEVDRRMMHDIGISLFQMMENAGLQLATVARDVFLDGTVKGKRVAVLAGTGGNAGGAIVAARRLVSWGAVCDIGFGHEVEALADVPKAQFAILKKIATINHIEPTDLGDDYDLILDGLIGYSLRGDPHGRTRDLIEAVNKSKTPALALDVPSGYDGEVGVRRDPILQASSTLTLALPKTGMNVQDRIPEIGRLFCADISCPPCVYRDLGLAAPYETPFSNSPIVELQ
ncbi:MAG: NAD(P)H-hydrate epimerase [Pseudoruegeria sp.]